LSKDGHPILVDCGLFQGLKNLRELNWETLPIKPSSIEAVVLTHAHLDHSGYLPKLVRDGFHGPIYCTEATRDVAELILLDSAHLQEKDAEYANRKGFSKHKPALPLYGVNDVEQTLRLFRSVPFHHPLQLSNCATIMFRYAGHILGAATVTIDWDDKSVAFSGDLGRYNDPVMFDPEPIQKADYLVLESTYGNRLHDPANPTEALQAVLERTVGRGGTVVIPAFAVGRAQSILYHLWKLKSVGRLGQTPIYLDSPMAISATKLLHEHQADHKIREALCEAVCNVATYIRNVEESKAITASDYPKIVIAASGMATGGRVLHHLKAFAPESKNTILFCGYQPPGTRGRAMLNGAEDIKIYGEWLPVHAEIAELPMLSAHGDANELMRWISGFKQPPSKVFIVHGEPEASEVLRVRINRELNWKTTVPRQDQTFTL
jgi:metallo-beta-lactamase family protein